MPLEILESSKARIANIVLDNFYVEAYAYFKLSAEFADIVSDVTMKNWRIKLIDGPAPVVPKDHIRHGTHWFRAKNINSLKLENIDIRDSKGYLAAWQNGLFDFDGCNGLKLINVKINGKET
jgi:hypothetical protein